MAAKVTFRGQTLLDSAEGTYQFTRGSIGRDIETIKLARSAGLLAADLGHSGAMHGLRVVFVVPKASVAAILSRVQGFYTLQDGALVVPDMPTMNDCILTGRPEWGLQQPVDSGKYRMPVTLTFVQLR